MAGNGVSSATRLKHERDRFVAFAFAGADILLELDANGVVRFAAGALALLGRSASELAGTPLAALVAAEHQDRLRRLLPGAGRADGRRTGRLDLCAADGARIGVRVSGYRLREMGDRTFMSLTHLGAGSDEATTSPADARTARTMPSDSFTALAVDKLTAASEGGPGFDLTLMELGGLTALRERVGVEEVEAFMEDVVERVRALSAGGEGVTAFGPEKLGVIHDSGAGVEQIGEEIAERSREMDPDGGGMSVGCTTIDLNAHDLSESDGIRALVYTVSQFATTGAALDFKSLREGYDAMLKDTFGRMEAFRRLLVADNFEVAFQPIVALQDRAVHHHEALVRFTDDPARTSPFELIKFAEDTDLILEFDYAMCRRVIRMIESAGREALPIAINISARSLTNDRFLASLTALLDRTPGMSKSLLFELTESFNISDLHAADSALQALRERGYRVCLDDFGVGATNLDSLRQLHVDFVKIDGSYVSSVLTTLRSKAFLKMIVELCGKLRIKTIAEFVEDEQTAMFLLYNDVEFGQGYLFGKPQLGLPAGEFAVARAAR
jgi:EAL domain-containing protein (putative c-di-GMP-specific phosphodiesterase class I)